MPSLIRTGVTYIGIDPGVNGGIAIIGSGRDVLGPNVILYPMPATETDIWEIINVTTGLLNEPRRAAIEWVNPAYQGCSKSANSKLYGNFMGCRMALIAAGISFDIVTPQKWQKGLGIKPGGKDKNRTKWKNLLKAKAQQLFPNQKITLKTADALLICEFLRRFNEGLLK